MSFIQRPAVMASSRVLSMARPKLAQGLYRSYAVQAPKASRLNFQPTKRLMEQVKEEHRAHTVTQRLRMIRKMPIELWPLAIVLAIAVIAAGYSLIRKLLTDPTLRLYRQNRKDD